MVSWRGNFLRDTFQNFNFFVLYLVAYDDNVFSKCVNVHHGDIAEGLNWSISLWEII